MSELEKFDYDAVYASMCMWEEIVQPTMDDLPWQDMRERLGMAEFRAVILRMGHLCDAAWDRAQEAHDSALADWRDRKTQAEVEGNPFTEDYPEEPGSFDWEFTPTWMRIAIDWSGDMPRLLGKKEIEP